MSFGYDSKDIRPVEITGFLEREPVKHKLPEGLLDYDPVQSVIDSVCRDGPVPGVEIVDDGREIVDLRRRENIFI